ncbi:pyrroloquinoline quinone biosynthesis protein PqqF [Serratia sp. root2]|uniref:pyrroloquinoline quinone biosynthesis protein PqqF n=1 Tax=Serratia sp. root2 TaxID=3059676 RepID=UPI00289093BA|nr:pyrroloquinoline quinone biosynthesis protein PqqF [Serratia sp. root2]MDT3250457.1 pyrroloquinoline quinone biosynthesis protein PqqF [Serratia sp. root2]
MQRHASSVRLGNGLQINMISDPAATRSAALMQVDAGSYHEPLTWPGLAHLLEHMLFRGSERFPALEGLMNWTPSQGGRLNATTQATRTCFFFEVGPEQFDTGVDRLIDMLIAPLLATEALDQEADIIDAEYQLLRTEGETLCEAAQQQAFDGIAAMHRFHIGSRAGFGEDMAVLRSALQQFHQRHYNAANMTLWLQGPQSPEQLRTMAEEYGARIAKADNHPPPAVSQAVPIGDRTLDLPGAPQLRLTFALNQPPATQRHWLRLLECLLLDEAPGSLMAWLRAEEYCDAARLIHATCGEACSLLTLAFTVIRGTAAEAAAIEAALFGWLEQLTGLTERQREHYSCLANRAFDRLAPLEQLRANAFGLPPVQATDPWAKQIAMLSSASMSRLSVRPGAGGEVTEYRGLPLKLTVFHPESASPATARFTFFPVAAVSPHNAPPPVGQVPLKHLPHDEGSPVLLLRPAPDVLFEPQRGYLLQSALRTLAAELAHQDGHLSVERHQGVWLLQLAGEEALIYRAVNAINHRLAAMSPAMQRDATRTFQRAQAREQGDIAIRRLLAQLPAALSVGLTPDRVSWQATLVGGNEVLRQGLAHLLSDFPEPIVTAGEYRIRTPAERVALSESGDENTRLLFYPLPETSASARWALQLLAQIYAPRYFQRLRVERNIGYVVHCAYYRCVDVEGIFFALQSPKYTIAQLDHYTAAFLQQMKLELAQLSDGELAAARNILLRRHSRGSDPGFQYARENVLENNPLPEYLEQINRDILSFWHRRIFASF